MKVIVKPFLVGLLVATPGLAQKPVGELIETDADRKPRIVTHGDCFIRGGTIHTVTAGTIEDGCILIQHGRIAAIGKRLAAPPGIPVIDAAGKHVTPGIIDAHSHISEEESNEATDSVTPEVRIRDVLDPNSLAIYQKLASGFTSSLILHGSANPIGGESVVIKLKYRHPVEDLPVPDAPRVVKFALGENVKQSFSDSSRRFPHTRMGVEAVYRRAFTEAKRYQHLWDDYYRDGYKKPHAVAPRRDLRLEALSDILSRKMWVHCHCYRADEMLMMLRLAKEYGFKLAALQHALEAYKIAPEIRAAGVGVSTFADAWAYKVEAFDAVPYNTAICSRAGIVTSVNTDSFAGVTTLNLDAAKAMKYGGLTENEALRLISINPAIQLGIDRRTGSLEVGKDADIAIWDGHPLSAYSRCFLTMVEGETLFQQRDAFILDKHATLHAVPSACTADHLHLPLPPLGRTYAIVGGTVHPVSGPDIVGGTVLLHDGRIVSVGRSAPPGDAIVVHARGLHVYPGLIDAGSILGLMEIQEVNATADITELGKFQSDLLSLTAIHSDSEHIAVTRAEGITTALSRPQGDPFGTGQIAGQSALIDLAGRTPEEMKVRSPVALHISYPEGLSGLPAEFRELVPTEQRKKLADRAKEDSREILEELERGKRYAESRVRDPRSTPEDPRLEALTPYVTGRAPVVFHVNTVSAIKKVLELSDQLGLKPILEGATQSWRVADLLAKKSVPVICSLPIVDATAFGAGAEDYDPYDAPFAQPALLHRAGVKVCFESGDAALAKNLRFCPSVASAFGLPRDAALRAATLGAAEILGAAGDVGSIEPGKRANLIVTDGDPFEVTTNLHYLFIDGKPVPLESRHTRLYQQYRNLK